MTQCSALPRFSGQIIVNDRKGPEVAREFIVRHAPGAKGSLESLLPLVEQAKADVVISDFGQSGMGGAYSECSVKVVPHNTHQKEINIASTDRDDYDAAKSLLNNGVAFNPFRLFLFRSPFDTEAGTWKSLRATLQKFIEPTA